MSNTIYTTGNALLWILMQVYLAKVKSNLIKDAHPVYEQKRIRSLEEKYRTAYENGTLSELFKE